MAGGIGIGGKGISVGGETVINPTVNAVSTVALDAESYVNQLPSATDTPLQISFGNAQTTSIINLQANGTITFVASGYFDIRIRVNVGRTNNTGIAVLLARALVNGTQLGPTQSVRMNNAAFNIPLEFTFSIFPFLGTQLKFEIMRDSSGVDDGGIFAFDPTLPGWNNSASADILITSWIGLS